MSNNDAKLLQDESLVSDDTADTGGTEDKSWALPFFTIWIGQAFSLVGSRMGGFALVWWLTQASGGSATVLATTSLVAMLPGVLLGPIAGALVDRWSRRRVMILADSLVAAFSLRGWHSSPGRAGCRFGTSTSSCSCEHWAARSTGPLCRPQPH